MVTSWLLYNLSVMTRLIMVVMVVVFMMRSIFNVISNRCRRLDIVNCLMFVLIAGLRNLRVMSIVLLKAIIIGVVRVSRI